MGSVQSPAVTRSQRRLYLGNLPPTVSDGEVLEFLNAAIISGGQQHVPGTRPVAAVQVGDHLSEWAFLFVRINRFERQGETKDTHLNRRFSERVQVCFGFVCSRNHFCADH